ncbi:MAG: LysE family translocator [Candidatus Bathyarchaeota archaeon]|nr:LysE family translocator [Candidatus Bathyarchaeota archaeon]MDH5733276.1 LysE family translocator [Candidatus Bathyarchaeota archaeon]
MIGSPKLLDALGFVSTVVLVTASGALAPGPLFFATVSHGTRSGAKGGLFFSLGHMLFELPLAVVLAFGFSTVVDQPIVRPLTGLLGGVMLLFFGILQIRESLAPKRGDQTMSSRILVKNPVILGIIFTGLNPYFIMWWLTIGIKLMSDLSVFLSLVSFLLMYVSHVWMDYGWLTLSAYLARRGTSLVSSKGYRILMAVFGVVLICFGLNYLITTLFI